MTKRVSRAQMRRERESLLASRSERDPLPADLQRRAEQFVPVSAEDSVWLVARPLFLAVMTSTSVRGADAFAKRCTALAAFDHLALVPTIITGRSALDRMASAASTSLGAGTRMRGVVRM